MDRLSFQRPVTVDIVPAGEVDALYRNPPSREAAECLGEVNWLTPEEARVWLGREESRARCFRPEHIAIADCGLRIAELGNPDCGFSGCGRAWC